MRASVVVPLHGALELTWGCLRALAAAGWDPRDELVLVDNASPDGTRAWLDEGVDELAVVVRNDVNHDFAGGCNDGAAIARGSVIVFLNNDTEVGAGWLDSLLLELEDPEVAIAGGLLLYPDGSIQHAGVAVERGRFPRHLYRNQPGTLQAARASYDVQVVTGALLAIRADVFAQVGGLDRAYRNGCEDIDLCWRVRDAGHRVRYTGRAATVHLESATEGRHDHDDANAVLLQERWGARARADRCFGDEIQVVADPQVPWRREQPLWSVTVPVCGPVGRTRRCLEAIRATIAGRDDVEVLLVDGVGSDDVLALLREQTTWAWVLLGDTGSNQALACQRGWRSSLGMLCVFVPDAAEVRPGWLDPLEAALRAPMTAVAGPLLVERDGSAVVAAGLEVRPADPVPRPALAGVDPQAATRACGPLREVQAVSAVGLAIRRSTLSAVGGFDEGVARSYAEVDLCMRLRVHGARVVVVTDSLVACDGEAVPGGGGERTRDDDRFRARATHVLVPDDHTFRDRLVLAPSVPGACGGVLVVAGVAGGLGAGAASLNDALLDAAADAGGRGGVAMLVFATDGVDRAVLLERAEQARAGNNEHVIVLGDAERIDAVVVPLHAVVVAGGADLALPMPAALLDWLDRLRLFGWPVHEADALDLPPPVPWRSTMGAAVPGAPVQLRDRWGIAPLASRRPTLPAPLVLEPPLDVEPSFDTRTRVALVVPPADATAAAQLLAAAFEQLGDDDACTAVVRISGDDESYTAVESAAERAEQRVTLPDVVIVEGGPEQDVAIARATGGSVVVASGMDRDALRLRSIARAVGADVVTIVVDRPAPRER